MFGSYPYRRALARRPDGVLFVALLVPLMIPKVPYKALNAIVFFGVFPVVGFMLLIGAALPFGLIGLLALIVNTVIWLRRRSARLHRARSRLSFFGGIGEIGSLARLAGRFRVLLRRDRIDVRRRRRLRRPAVRDMPRATWRTFAARPRTRWAAVSSLWMDLGLLGAARSSA